MRILYVSSSTVPSRSANSVHVMKMCQAFAGNGHEVRLLTLDRPGQTEAGVQDVFAHYGVNPGFEVAKKPFPGLPGGQWLYVLSAWQEALSWKPDLVFGRYFPAMATLGILGFPVIVELHEKVWERGGMGRDLARRLFRAKHFQGLVVISEALKQMYLAEGMLPAERIQVAHDAADPAPRFPRRNGNGGGNGKGNERKFQAGYIGGVYPGRGIELLLDCADALPDVEFHFVGGTRADLEKLASRQLGHNVICHGYQPPERIPEIRGNLDVLLAPYQRKVAIFGGKGDTSAFMSPLKIFEYMASGRPMICSDMPVLREVLNESNAILVDPEDTAGWIGAIEQLRDEPSLADRIAQAALEDFEQHYTWEHRAKQVLQGCASST